MPPWSFWMRTVFVLALSVPACGSSGSTDENEAGAEGTDAGLSQDAGSLNGLAISNPACRLCSPSRQFHL